MTRWVAPEARTGSVMANSSSGLAVEEVDVVTLDRKPVEAPRDSATGYVSDGHGNVRMMATQQTTETGYAKRVIDFHYRPAGGGRWTDLSSVTFEAGLYYGFEPVAVDAAENVVYGFDDNKGYQGLFKMALDGTGVTTLVLAKDGADVDGLIRIGRNRRIVGASYATEQRREQNTSIRSSSTSPGSLAKALGGDKQVGIVDATADEGKLLIFASSDVEPGKYYLFDKGTKQLGEIVRRAPS